MPKGDKNITKTEAIDRVLKDKVSKSLPDGFFDEVAKNLDKYGAIQQFHKSSNNPKIMKQWIKLYWRNRSAFEKTCDDLGVNSESVHEWIDKFPFFRAAKEKVETLLSEKIEQHLISKAIDDDNPGNVVAQIFYLKNNHPRYAENQQFGGPINTRVWFAPPPEAEQLKPPTDDDKENSDKST